jgi:hypothetical protein
MEVYITKVLKPWVQTIIKEKGLPPDQKAIFFIDVYPIHTGKPFREFFFKNAPNIFLV